MIMSVVSLLLLLTILQTDHLGYNSSAAVGLQKKVLEGSEDFKVHSRVLGNVFYLMASQVTEKKTLSGIERLLLEACPE